MSQAVFAFSAAGMGLQRKPQVNYIARQGKVYVVQLTIVPVGGLGQLFLEKLDARTLRITSLSPYNAS